MTTATRDQDWWDRLYGAGDDTLTSEATAPTSPGEPTSRGEGRPGQPQMAPTTPAQEAPRPRFVAAPGGAVSDAERTEPNLAPSPESPVEERPTETPGRSEDSPDTDTSADSPGTDARDANRTPTPETRRVRRIRLTGGRLPAPGTVIDLDKVNEDTPDSAADTIPQDTDLPADSDGQAPQRDEPPAEADTDDETPADNRERRHRIAKDGREKTTKKPKRKQRKPAPDPDDTPLNRDGIPQLVVDDLIDAMPDGHVRRGAEAGSDWLIEHTGQIPHTIADHVEEHRLVARVARSWTLLRALLGWALYNCTAAAAGQWFTAWFTAGRVPGLPEGVAHTLHYLASTSSIYLAAGAGISATGMLWITFDRATHGRCVAKAQTARESPDVMRRALNWWPIPAWIFRIPLASVAAGTAAVIGTTTITLATGATP